tara:strand:+ start:38 stop:298 length:261 start_codon:yes stop_codon:yes gene_type:complete
LLDASELTLTLEGGRSVADDVNINLDSPEITAPISVELSGTSIVEGVKNGLNEFVQNVKEGSDEALTVVYLGVMFFAAGLFLWRRV